jgi:hypothetical protein
MFTPGQIKKLENPLNRPRWSMEDISNAVTIHAAGPRAYRLLIKKKYPLPAISTLRSWCKKIKLVSGVVLKPVLNILKNTDLNNLEKVCILSFDECKNCRTYLYDKTT